MFKPKIQKNDKLSNLFFFEISGFYGNLTVN
jgi:hypothetical protein